MLMITWFYRFVSCEYIIKVKISGKILGLLPKPETLALHHHCQESNGVIQAGRWDQQTPVIHLLHEVFGCCGKHVPAG